MKRRLVTLAMAALLALPAVANAEVNDELFWERKDQVALFPSLGAIPPAMMELSSKVKQMVTSMFTSTADTRPQPDVGSTSTQSDHLF